MTLFRRHREFLDDAMKTVVEVSSIAEIEKITGYTNVTVKKYSYDHRIMWDTYIVCENGRACGFTNGLLK